MMREERRNMIEFIAKIGDFHKQELLYMTDAEVEHIYNRTYYLFQEIAE
jgi:hypothetical protein